MDTWNAWFLEVLETVGMVPYSVANAGARRHILGNQASHPFAFHRTILGLADLSLA